MRRTRHLWTAVAAALLLTPGAAARADDRDPSVHIEREPAGAAGHNDTPATAERLARSDRGIAGNLSEPTDIDVYAVRLRAGDVVGAAVAGSPLRLSLNDPAGREAIGSVGNLSFFYPAASPLPRGEPGKPVLHHVAARSGRYTLAVQGGTGPYEVTLAVLRPGPEGDRRGTVQTLYLDVDGAVVDTTNFRLSGAIPGIRTLSPLAAFLARWGLTAADEPALVRAAVTTVRRILGPDVLTRANPDAAVRIVSSREVPDPGDDPNVTRVVIGGTVAEAVFEGPTIGVAESVDPGNLVQAETALVLLDLLSGPPDDPSAPLEGRASLNRYLTGASDRIGFVGRILGTLAAHEAGHLYGCLHTDPATGPDDLMDGGGPPNPAAAYGVGPDGIGGTADDVRARLGRDGFAPGFTGIQDTLAVTAFGLGRGRARR